MVTLSWVKRDIGGWCRFLKLNLDTVSTKGGVYIIWRSGNPGRVVYVGQGDVRERLRSHRLRSEICAHGQIGELHVTWADVPASQRDGVERYLADQWSPLVGDAHPTAAPIAVNSPW